MENPENNIRKDVIEYVNANIDILNDEEKIKVWTSLSKEISKKYFEDHQKKVMNMMIFAAERSLNENK